MSILAIIPARGGSKGIPGKNISLLAGKPLIAYAIENALASRHVDRVVVSTDDSKIAEVSKRYGAEVICRPVQISGDSASSESALLHSLDYLKETEGYEPELVVFLQCTSPLTLPEDIDGTVDVLLQTGADSAFAATDFHYFLWKRDEAGNAVGINHDKNVRPLRQDKEPQLLETGAVYVMRTEGFRKAEHRFFGKTTVYEVPPDRCLEIDEPVDLDVAEMLTRRRQHGCNLALLPYPIEGVALDFDGVFTDNRVLVFGDGREAVSCNRSDGLGLSRLRKTGIPVVVLSSEENPVGKARCDKLKIECKIGLKDKAEELRKWIEKHHLDPSRVIFVGNDVNDLGCLEAVGCGVVVNDAHPTLRCAARIVLASGGGSGAIREIVDMIEQKLEEHGNAKTG